MQKITMLFNQVIGDPEASDSAGYSETWYRDGTSEDNIAAARQLIGARTGMLTSQASVIGLRVQTVGGLAESLRVQFQGNVQRDGDLPQVALNIKLTGADPQYKKTMQIRGIPDGRVVFGRYKPAEAFDAAFAQWWQQLRNDGWRFQARDRTLPRVQIFNIAADGVFSIAPGSTWDAGQKCILRFCRNVNGVNVSGVYDLESRTNDQVGKIRNWSGGVVLNSGKFAKYGLTYPTIGKGMIQNATTRKVGRPFSQFRGRVPTR